MHERVGGVEHGLELALDGSTGAAAPVACVHVKAECRLSCIRVDPPATGEPRTGLTVLRARREPKRRFGTRRSRRPIAAPRSEEHTSELQSRLHLVCRLLLEKKKRPQTTRENNSSGAKAKLLRLT